MTSASLPAAVRRRILAQLFGGTPTVSLLSGDTEMTERVPATFTIDNDRATLSTPLVHSNVPIQVSLTHWAIWQGSELQWTTPLPSPIVHYSLPNRVESLPGDLVFSL